MMVRLVFGLVFQFLSVPSLILGEAQAQNPNAFPDPTPPIVRNLRNILSQTPDEIFTATNSNINKSLLVGDLNNDGRDDLVWIDKFAIIPNTNGVFIAINDGGGERRIFPLLAAHTRPASYAALLDLNSDGLLELITIHDDGKVFLYRNDYRNSPAGILPANPADQWDIPGDPVRTFSSVDIRVGDIGKLGNEIPPHHRVPGGPSKDDWLVATGVYIWGFGWYDLGYITIRGIYDPSEPTRRITGLQVNRTQIGMGRDTRDLKLYDIDGNGILDIVSVEQDLWRFGSAAVRIQYGGGNGVFDGGRGDAVATRNEQCIEAENVTAGDIDYDGDMDIIVSCPRKGLAIFTQVPGTTRPEFDVEIHSLLNGQTQLEGVSTVKLHDIDGVGWPHTEKELIVYGVQQFGFDGRILIFRNTPSGFDFQYPIGVYDGGEYFPTPRERSQPDVFELGDADGDGYPDLFVYPYRVGRTGYFKIAVLKNLAPVMQTAYATETWGSEHGGQAPISFQILSPPRIGNKNFHVRLEGLPSFNPISLIVGNSWAGNPISANCNLEVNMQNLGNLAEIENRTLHGFSNENGVVDFTFPIDDPRILHFMDAYFTYPFVNLYLQAFFPAANGNGLGCSQGFRFQTMPGELMR